MDAEHLKKKYERLYRLAFKVRHFQIRYERDHSSADRDQARRYQRDLDKILKEESDFKKSMLQELFNG